MKIKNLLTKDYYRYWIYRLRKTEITNRMFLDPVVFFCFLAFFLINAWLFFPGHIEVHIPDLNSQVSVVDTLIRVLSIFLGILFSFIVLSFNVFSKYFGRFAFQMFFTLKSIKRLFTFLVLTLVYLLYASTYLRGCQVPGSYSNLVYSNSLMFSLTATISIVPTIVNLLRQSQNRAHIKALIKKLNVDWTISYLENVEWSDEKEKHFEKDPITLLTEIGTSSLKEFDFTTLRLIIDGCVEYFKLVTQSKEKGITPLELYFEFTKMLLNLYQVAVKERNESGMLMLVNSRFDLEEFVIDNQDKIQINDYHGKYMGYKFKFEIKDYFNRAAQFNEDSVCERIIDTYRDFGKKLINDVLVSNFKYDPKDRIKSMDEQSIIQSYITELDYLMSIVIQTRKFHLYKTISNLYYTLDSVTASSKNTHESKRFILHVLDYSKYETLEKYLTISAAKNLSSLEYPYYLSPNTVLREAQISIPFLGMLKSINLLFATGVLSNNTINCLKSDSFYLIRNIADGDSHKKLLLLCIRKFSEIRNFIKENDTDYRKDIYVKLSMYAGYVENFIKENGITDQEINDEMAAAISGFTLADSFSKELKNKGHIFDERIA